jgi:hypothetical protein
LFDWCLFKREELGGTFGFSGILCLPELSEFVLGGAGAFVLIRKKLKAYVAPWIAFIVGIHFISLKSVFDDPSLWLLAALMVAVSIIAVRVAPKLQVANSAITGIGAGTVLFGYAILGLIRFMSV